MFSYKWLGQGGFDVALGDKRLIIDPYLSDSVVKVDGFKRVMPLPIEPKDLRADLIITTHDHQDHLDPDTIAYAPKGENAYAGPESCLEHMRELGIQDNQLHRLGSGDVMHLGEARIMGVPAVHTAPEAIGVFVEYHGVHLYFSGNTVYDRVLEDIGALRVDVMFICINGRLGNMDYHEAAKLANILKPRVVVPNHYGMFVENTIDPQLFVDEMQGSGIHVHVPEFNVACDIHALLGVSENG